MRRFVRNDFALFLMILVLSSLTVGVVTNICELNDVHAAKDQERTLTLEEAVAQSLALNQDLREAKLNLETAEEELELVNKTLTVTGSIQDNRNEKNSETEDKLRTSGEIGLNDKWSLSTIFDEVDESNSFGVTYNPFNLDQERRIIEKELNLAGKTAAYENEKIAVIIEVKKAYYEAVQKETLEQLAEENLRLSKEYFVMTESLFKSGKISKLDVLEAGQQVKVAETAQVTAELNKEMARFKLETAMGRRLNGITLSSSFEDTISSEQIDIEASLDRAILKSPDRRVKVMGIELAEIEAKIASLYKVSGLSLNAGVKQYDMSDITTYSLSIGGPLFIENGKGSLEVAEKKAETSKLGLEIYDRNLKAGVLEALRYWKLAELGIAPSKELVDVSKEKLEIVTLRYQHGAAAGFEVVQAQQALANAREKYWQAWLNWQKAKEDFYRAVWGKPVIN